MELMIAAMDKFRRMYGVAANPEDMPEEWAATVAEIDEALREIALYDEEGR